MAVGSSNLKGQKIARAFLVAFVGLVLLAAMYVGAYIVQGENFDSIQLSVEDGCDLDAVAVDGNKRHVWFGNSIFLNGGIYEMSVTVNGQSSPLERTVVPMGENYMFVGCNPARFSIQQ